MRENKVWELTNKISMPDKEYTASRHCSISDEVVREIFDYWNTKKIVKHKQVKPRMTLAIDRAINYHGYTKEEILIAIDHYSDILKESEVQTNGYKQYVWTLADFIGKPNAMPCYVDDGTRWINYKKRLKNKIKPLSNDNNALSYKQGDEAYLKYLQIVKTLPYQEYLQTHHWKNFREKAIVNSSCQCQVCSSPLNINVHHKNYDCLGKETFSDVVILCKSCHIKFHRTKIDD